MVDEPEIVVGSGIPIPPIPGRREPGPVSVTIRRLEPGHHAFVRNMTPAGVGQAIARAVKLAPGKSFTTRTTDGGVTIWRLT